MEFRTSFRGYRAISPRRGFPLGAQLPQGRQFRCGAAGRGLLMSVLMAMSMPMAVMLFNCTLGSFAASSSFVSAARNRCNYTPDRAEVGYLRAAIPCFVSR